MFEVVEPYRNAACLDVHMIFEIHVKRPIKPVGKEKIRSYGQENPIILPGSLCQPELEGLPAAVKCHLSAACSWFYRSNRHTDCPSLRSDIAIPPLCILLSATKALSRRQQRHFADAHSEHSVFRAHHTQAT